ncbi:hypothetical protein GCM10009078_33130 [Cupriavidus gilardii]
MLALTLTLQTQTQTQKRSQARGDNGPENDSFDGFMAGNAGRAASRESGWRQCRECRQHRVEPRCNGCHAQRDGVATAPDPQRGASMPAPQARGPGA